MVNLNLNSKLKVPWENKDERIVLAAVQDYYTTMGRAISERDLSIFEEKYGYLQPTGKRGDGINAGIQHITRHLNSDSVKGYRNFSLRCWSPSLR